MLRDGSGAVTPPSLGLFTDTLGLPFDSPQQALAQVPVGRARWDMAMYVRCRRPRHQCGATSRELQQHPSLAQEQG